MAAYDPRVTTPGGPVAEDDWFAQQGPPVAGGAPRTYADAQAAFHQLFPGETLTPQMLRDHEAELNALGFQLRPNAQGVVGKIQWGNEPIVDVIQGAGSGVNRKQWLAGGPAGGSAQSLAELQASPGYQFRLGEGAKALERSAAARGTLLTGGTLKGLTRYGQDYASNEYQNRVNQLAGLSQMGANAAAGQAGANAAYGNAAGDLMTQQGNAQAAGTVGSANAWQQGIGNATNMAQMYYLSRLMQPGAPGGGGNYSTYAPGGPDFVGPMRP